MCLGCGYGVILLCVVDVIEIHTPFFPTLLLLLQVQETGGRQLGQSQWDSPSRN